MKKTLCCLIIVNLIAGCNVDTPENKPITPTIEEQPKENELDVSKKEIKLEDIISIEIIQVEGFTGWAKSLGSRSTIEIPKLLFDTEDAKQFNEQIASIAEECKTVLSKIKDKNPLEIHFLNVDCYLTKDILSIVIKHDPWVNGIGGYYSIYEVYNFSAINGEKLTNQEIISKLGLDQEKLQMQIDNFAKEYRDCSTFSEHELKSQCIYATESDIFQDDKKFSTDIIDNQYFYIENEFTAGMYVFLYGAFQKFEKFQIQL